MAVLPVMSLRARMYLGFAALLALAVFEGAWGLHYLRVLNGRLDQVYATDLLKIKRLSEMKSALFQTRLDVAAHIRAQTTEQMNTLANAVSQRRQAMELTLETFRATELAPVETNCWGHSRSQLVFIASVLRTRC